MTTTLEGGWGSASRPGRFLPPGKARYPLYRRLGGPWGRSGQVRKISPPPGFDSRTVQPVASRCIDYATRPTKCNTVWYINFLCVLINSSKTKWKPFLSKAPRLLPFVLLIRATCRWRCAALVEWLLTGETEILWEKPIPCHFVCPPPMSHGLTWYRIRASTVRDRQLTAWAV